MKALDYDGTDHLIDKIHDLINSGGSADYIVEEGTSGIWTYRKWESGVYEAWGKEQRSTAMTNSIGAGQYYGNVTFDISALGLTNIISAQVTGQASGTYFGTKIEAWSTSSIQVSSRASASTTATVMYIFDLKGLWKEFTPSVSRAVYHLGDLKLGSAETQVSLSANGTAWDTITVPSDRTLVAPAGFYWYGNYNTSITCYAYRQASANQIQVALRNWANASTTITMYYSYIYV